MTQEQPFALCSEQRREVIPGYQYLGALISSGIRKPPDSLRRIRHQNGRLAVLKDMKLGVKKPDQSFSLILADRPLSSRR